MRYPGFQQEGTGYHLHLDWMQHHHLMMQYRQETPTVADLRTVNSSLHFVACSYIPHPSPSGSFSFLLRYSVSLLPQNQTLTVCYCIRTRQDSAKDPALNAKIFGFVMASNFELSGIVLLEPCLQWRRYCLTGSPDFLASPAWSRSRKNRPPQLLASAVLVECAHRFLTEITMSVMRLLASDWELDYCSGRVQKPTDPSLRHGRLARTTRLPLPDLLAGPCFRDDFGSALEHSQCGKSAWVRVSATACRLQARDAGLH